jgi:hypothetical protein
MAHKKLAQLENIKNNKDYQMIEKIAGQKALK